MRPQKKSNNINRNYFCVQYVVAQSLAKGSHYEATDRFRYCCSGRRFGARRMHEPVRPRAARGRRRPARRRSGSGHWRCGWRRAWRRSRRGDRRRQWRRDRRRYDTATAPTSRRLWSRLRLWLPAAACSGRLWLRACPERLRLPPSVPLILALRVEIRRDWRATSKSQPGGVDLINSARCRAFAAGGKFFPTAEASIMRG
jgi:hypothetical protein